MVADIRPGTASSSPGFDVIATGAKVLFKANDGVNGTELWQCLPPYIASTTTMVRDIRSGSGSSTPNAFYAVADNARVLMLADDGLRGRELWVTDGSAQGTAPITDIVAGSSDIQWVARAGANVFFAVDDGVHGVELWALHFRAFGGALAEPFGHGCPGTGNLTPAAAGFGVPVLGNQAFAAQVSSARPSSPAVMLLGANRSELALGGGCFLWVGLPVPLALSTITSAAGVGSIGLPIPAGSELVGAELFVQWAVADPNGAFAGAASISDGLRVVIGNP
jgi:ELWxxDGT repeat protein